MHPWLALRGYEYVICIYYLGIRIRYSYTFHRCNIRSYVRKNATGNSKVFFDSSTKINIIITIKYIIYIIPFYDISQFRNIIKSDVVRRMSFKRDQRAFRLVFAMNICYLLSWLPYGVLAFIHMFISKR